MHDGVRDAAQEEPLHRTFAARPDDGQVVLAALHLLGEGGLGTAGEQLVGRWNLGLHEVLHQPTQEFPRFLRCLVGVPLRFRKSAGPHRQLVRHDVYERDVGRVPERFLLQEVQGGRRVFGALHGHQRAPQGVHRFAHQQNRTRGVRDDGTRDASQEGFL